jgi:dolichol-phosphate mannosyltransferase
MVPEISIVSPLHNEVANVLPLAQQVFEAFRSERRPLELILVDDASSDGTWEKMLEARKADARVQPLRHLKQSGQSAALWTGFNASRGSIIATLDGDLQNDPAELPRLLSELSTCDMACGARTNRQDSSLRKFSSRIAWMARKLVLGVDFRDTGCNLRVFKHSVLAAIPPFDGFHRFMPILAQGGGAIVKEIPVAHRPRVAGQSKYGVWNRLGRGLYDLAMVRWYGKRQLKSVPVARPDL